MDKLAQIDNFEELQCTANRCMGVCDNVHVLNFEPSALDGFVRYVKELNALLKGDKKNRDEFLDKAMLQDDLLSNLAISKEDVDTRESFVADAVAWFHRTFDADNSDIAEFFDIKDYRGFVEDFIRKNKILFSDSVVDKTTMEEGVADMEELLDLYSDETMDQSHRMPGEPSI